MPSQTSLLTSGTLRTHSCTFGLVFVRFFHRTLQRSHRKTRVVLRTVERIQFFSAAMRDLSVARTTTILLAMRSRRTFALPACYFLLIQHRNTGHRRQLTIFPPDYPCLLHRHCLHLRLTASLLIVVVVLLRGRWFASIGKDGKTDPNKI